MPIAIACYERPNHAERPDTQVDGLAHQLHRAISPEAPFGYIDVSEPTTEELADQAVRAAAATPGDVRAGTYEVLHTGDRPAVPFDAADSAATTRFINCLSFDPGGHDTAFAVWQEINSYMVTKPGYRWHRLHRRTHDDAPFGLVNVVEWESPAAWEAAHDDGFRALAARPDLPFAATPTLCVTV